MSCNNLHDEDDTGSWEIGGMELADPFILVTDSVYYAYGTYSNNADEGFRVYKSTNLMQWELCEGYALNKKDVWGEGEFWAPEVYWIESLDKYIMYYSAEERLCCAISDNPTGPFQSNRKPLLPGKNIDPNLLRTSQGEAYLYYAKTTNIGNTIWCSRLTEDFQNIIPNTEVNCISPSQEWEIDYINEGPEVLEHKGKYYMMFSGNGYSKPFYGIGLATSDSPTGPWMKYDHNPILQYPVYKGITYEGAGHNCLFTDHDGIPRTVFHVHPKPGIPDPRILIIATFKFPEDQEEEIKILDDYKLPYVI